MKVYTRTGDTGTTSLVGGTRVSKDSARLEAYGTVDELNAHLGLIIASNIPDPQLVLTLTTVQNRLFDIGAALATEEDSKWQPQPFREENILMLEKKIDLMEEGLTRQNRFILPQGSKASCHAQVARTVARRAERRIVTLAATTAVDPLIIKYINRLSDYLFVLARYLNHLASVPDTYWEPETSVK